MLITNYSLLITLPILYILVLLLIINKLSFFKTSGIPFKYLSIIFIVNILSGFFLLLIYKYYYGTNGSDIFNYFKDGEVIYNVANTSYSDFIKLITGVGNYSNELEVYLRENTNFWFKAFNYNLLNDNRLIIRINAILHIISNHNIYVHSIFFSFFSFTGLTALFKLFNQFYKNKLIVVIIVFFIPSVIIWSSAMLKESVLMFSLGMFLLSFFELLNNKNLTGNIVIIMLSVFLLFMLKFYVLFALIPGLIFLIINKFYNKNPIFTFSIIYIISILLFFNFQHFSNYNLVEIMSFKQHDFIKMINESKNIGSKVDIPILEPNFISFFSATPNALLNTFLRPSIFDIHSPIVIPAVIENVLFLLLFILSIIYFNKINFTKNLPIIIFSFSFVITLSIILGLTTPVLGALVRYKVPYLPFFALILLLSSKIKLKKHFD